MSFYFADIIRDFWRKYNKAHTKIEFQQLLWQAKLDCMEVLEALEGEEFLTFYDQSPLFAIISEVHRICPEAVIELAEKDEFFATALELFSNYSEEKRDLLRDTFLKLA